MARRSCPLEGFEQCDTVPDELKKLSRSFLALVRILGDPIKLDLFSKSRFTKHCKWAADDSVGSAISAVMPFWRGIIPQRCPEVRFGRKADLIPMLMPVAHPSRFVSEPTSRPCGIK
jgi:hypothetical protein